MTNEPWMEVHFHRNSLIRGIIIHTGMPSNSSNEIRIPLVVHSANRPTGRDHAASFSLLG
jgi:hypothetical protein